MKRRIQFEYIFEYAIFIYLVGTGIFFSSQYTQIEGLPQLLATRILLIFYLIFRKNLYAKIVKNISLQSALYLFSMLLVIPILYDETRLFIHIIFPDFFDSTIVNLELAVVGQPINLMIDDLYHPVLNEIFLFCYFSYYYFLLIVPAVLIVKKQFKETIRYYNHVFLCLLSSFIMYFLFPIEGPRWFFQDQFTAVLDGFVFTQLIEWLIWNQAVHGGAFPSMHTCAGILSWYTLRKTHKTSAYITLPILIGLIISTVWGRYHYVLDTAVGLLMACAAIVFVRKITKNKDVALTSKLQ